MNKTVQRIVVFLLVALTAFGMFPAALATDIGPEDTMTDPTLPAENDGEGIPIEGKLIEVDENVYVAYYKMGRRERYLEERDKANNVYSYDALDKDGMKGEEMFQDPAMESLDDLALSKELLIQLHRCIEMLPRAERELIHAIYFEGLSDTKYAERINKSQAGISRKHKKILSKLKILLNFMGSL